MLSMILTRQDDEAGILQGAEQEPAESERFLLQVLGQQAGVALANARLHARGAGAGRTATGRQPGLAADRGDPRQAGCKPWPRPRRGCEATWSPRCSGARTGHKRSIGPRFSAMTSAARTGLWWLRGAMAPTRWAGFFTPYAAPPGRAGSDRCSPSSLMRLSSWRTRRLRGRSSGPPWPPTGTVPSAGSGWVAAAAVPTRSRIPTTKRSWP